MEYNVNTAVIGGGPAGMACAVTLQKNGISNCVIDKAVFPRNKTCAGLVTDKTYRLLEQLLSEHRDLMPGMFVNRISETAIFDRCRQAARTQTDVCFYLTYRRTFDHTLVEVYKADGGTMLEGQRNYRTDHEKKCITLQDGTTVRYRYLVFADGALSSAHKVFRTKPADMCFCLETFIPAREIDTTAIQIHFGYLSPGYVWLFPYGDQVSAGAGTSAENAKACVDVLKTFLRDLGTDENAWPFRGAYVPFGGMADQSLLPDNEILIGDAGGFADPIYAEGLYMALYTGIRAAEAMSADAPKKAFLTGIKPVCRMIKSGRRLQKILYGSRGEKLFREKMTGRDAFLKFYCDRQVSSYCYSHMDPRLFMDYKSSKKQK